MAVADPGKRVGQVSERIDVVQLTGFDQGGDDGPMFGAAVGACEQCIFPVQRDRTYRALDSVVVELDTVIIDKARRTLPASERIADGVSYAGGKMLGRMAVLFQRLSTHRSAAFRSAALGGAQSCSIKLKFGE